MGAFQKKWVYPFCDKEAKSRELLGGKGANLAKMTKAGLPVPPGFTITTEACNYYAKHHKTFPDGLWKQCIASIREVEKQTGKGFGDPENPLLVSVRSGAPISMPGMMDTVLNLGLNDKTAEALAQTSNNRRFALDAYRRFISMFGNVVLGIRMSRFERVFAMMKSGRNGNQGELSSEQLEEVIKAYKKIIHSEPALPILPEDPYEQLKMAIAAVFNSWNGRRARDYRRINGISDSLGTAVNIQAMVFGNLNWESGTGVAFTRNPSSGEKAVYGEYLMNAQGEDVVAGTRTPSAIETLAEQNKAIYERFLNITQKLEHLYGDMQDIEFTIQEGKLYLLQTRTGVRTGAAAVKIAVDMVKEGLIDRDTAIYARISTEQLRSTCFTQRSIQKRN